MPRPPDEFHYSDENEFGPSYPVATYEGRTRVELSLFVGVFKTLELKIENATGFPIVECGVTHPALQAGCQLLSTGRARLDLLLTQPVDCELIVLVNDGTVEHEEMHRDGERLIIRVRPQ